jgi:hypothetical protein
MCSIKKFETGSFDLMNVFKFKILTLCFCVTWALTSSAQLISEQLFKTHLRWIFNTPKEQIVIKKIGNYVSIETLNINLFQQMVTDFTKFKVNADYLESIDFINENFPANPATIKIKVKNEAIELFSFYKDDSNQMVMDFWINKDIVTAQTAAVVKVDPTPLKPIAKVEAPKKIFKKPISIPVLKKENLDPEAKNYRDFRYGAAFIWDYSALIPPLEQDVILESKIPENFYPLKDRENINDEKESHMQLNINFYRKESWGLLAKSIDLYEKKYGKDKNYILNQFIKANALLKNNLVEKNPTITITAVNMLNNLAEQTNDSYMKFAIYRYTIEHTIGLKDYIRAAQLARNLYLVATQNFDNEMIILSTRVILHSLARLKQIDKIREFVNEKPVLRTLPKQEADAYISYVQLSHGETEELIKEYDKKSKGYAQPVHPTILFNLAESYFREAKYSEAIKYFDQFVTHYSHLSQATQARVRLALSFELINKPIKEVLALYRNAIDRATIAEYRYEAKLRYVGVRLNRKINPTKDDSEVLVFLDKTPAEEKEMHQNLNKLLWLVRLRTYINQEQYKEALTYFTTLPIDSMSLLDKRVFLGDGSEIVLGVIQQMYNTQEYTNAIKTWETYRYKFDNQIASNPYLNFIICESYLRLGLFESFTKGIEKLRKLKSEPTRNYPLWANGSKNIKIDELISELELIKAVNNGEWDKASELLSKMPETKRELLNYEYYNGLIKYHNQKFSEAISSFEEILVSQNQANSISPTQLKELISFYTEALFKVEESEKFQRNISAMIKDIKNSDQENLKANLERMEYLVIESYFSEKEPKYSEILKFIQGFNNQYIKSNYSDRLTLIKGISLVRGKSLQEGEEVLKALMTKQDAPGYLKELAKSEIAVLELKKKNI